MVSNNNGYSNLRAAYSSVVKVIRLVEGKGPGRTSGAAIYTWGESTDIIDPYLGVPGQMECRLDVQFVAPGLAAPMPAESGSVIPRRGRVFFDIPDDYSYVRAGDRLIPVEGAFIGSMFEIRVPPEPAQDFFGPVHMEAEIIEVNINVSKFPGVDPGKIVH